LSPGPHGSCVGNDRAARFYEKQGWHRAGSVVIDVELPAGVWPLEVWRYEKHLLLAQGEDA